MGNYNKRPADRNFQKLAEQVNNTIIENDGLVGDQQAQVEFLMSLERKFQYFIEKYQQTFKIYEKFVKYITKDVGNILSAQSYFREFSTTFSSGISSIFRENDYRRISDYKINYQFINFIVKNWKGDLPDRPNRYYKEYCEARRILIENNLPLAINRAKLFYRKTPQSHLTLLDFIGICTDGLIVGIDKYAEDEYKRKWRSVCIGRMVGFMIEEYSKTFIRMSPKHRKILYRANSLRFRLKLEKIVDIAKAVNDSFEMEKEEGKSVPKLPISEIEITSLLNGSGYLSADLEMRGDAPDDNYSGVTIYDITASSSDTEEEASNNQILNKVSDKLKDLEIMERKVIKLKGVNL